jgi:hypothetical protein
MEDERPDYLSYLLRLWRVRERGPPAWRASLQRPGSGERASFATLDDLFAYLREQTGVRSDAEHADSRKDVEREEDHAG